MTDRELLELAAKAAGYKICSIQNGKLNCYGLDGKHNFHWNPLTDDGDALRLAVKLKLEGFRIGSNSSWVEAHPKSLTFYKDDPYAATRRAIVRAAAEIGKAMGSESPKLICPRCGVDRFKVPCPGPFHMCPIHGEAQ